ncbi:hypothetical protein BHU72_00185 [Desulfuribacillus stibiiarsenatis]|uniref:DUF8042 domain-containing protein n=1 Tax=Desulfuribacillus stibiiarsenatis TaxID=1390249 RepID=A0A1E5L9C3_9FIRM|nr:hypothetical protein [Desulfuribacillus stibiiarsenatis]OEH86731.1 hypothetical protein BHU72_00185 [Desulfuribacillus stibiiarsenatis]
MDVNKQLIDESIESFREYLPKLIKGSEQVLEYFQSQQDGEAFSTLVYVIEGLQWTLDLVSLISPHLESKGIIIEESRITEVMNDFHQALENQDLVLISDILEYEVLEILREWLNSLNKH